MANTTLNTRIQLKYDTYANWTTNNPVLLSGEIAVVVVPASSGAVPNEPTILFKVGDGSAKFNALQWVAAPAADVYSWAKASTKPTYTADEIEGLEEYISGQIQDTDTQYQIIASGTNGIQLQSRPKTGGEWSNVGSPITITYTLAEGSANGTVAFNGVDVPVHGLGTAAYEASTAFDAAGSAAAVQTAVVGTSSDASTAITIYGTRKYAEEQATAAQTAATTAANSYTDGQITQVKTDLIGTGDATSTTIKGAVAESKTYADAQIAAKIGSVYKPAGSVAFADLPETPSAATLGNVYNVTDAFEADTRFVTGEQGDSYPAGSNVAVVQIEEAYYFDVLAGTVDLSAYSTTTQMNSAISTAVDGAKTELIGSGSATSTTIKGAVAEANTYADGLNTTMDSRVDALETNVGGTPVATQIQTAIQALDKADSAVAKQFVTAVSETDGIISVTRAALQASDIPTIQQSQVNGLTAALDAKANTADLAEIATTGDAADLVQVPGEYLILNCGSSTVNI